MAIGAVLRQAREARGMMLEDVEAVTKIRRRYLEALEEERFDILPGRVFARGFLHTYARYLGLDAGPLLQELDLVYPPERGMLKMETRERVDEQSETWWDRLQPRVMRSRRNAFAPRRSLAGRVVFTLTAVVLLAAVGLGLWIWRGGGVGPGSMEAEEKTPPGGIGQVSPPPVQMAQQEERQEGISLLINVTQQSSWVQVVVDGNTAFSGELVAGQSKSFQGRERVFLWLGNAGVVQVRLNGQDLGYLGGVGKVIKKEFVAPRQG